MTTVKELAYDIVKREGGYVNDPDDPGGATKYGVTIGTMRRLGLDLDKDGDVDTNDVKKLTVEQAVNIFLKYYFYGPKIDKLPESVQASVFDMYVNAGSNAVKILQRLVTKMGYPTSADGIIGPLTLAAVEKAYQGSKAFFADAYGVERRNYYFSLADKNPSLRKYARTLAGGKGGWIKRAEEFISPKYHMTDKEFQKRVAAW